MVYRPAHVDAIQINGLVKRYARDAPNAVDGVDLDIHSGELFGLLGPNGAGKTTMVGVATTRVRLTEGRVVVGGVDVRHDPVGVKRLIGVVTQHNTLDRACTVWENLYYHCRFFGMRAADSRVRAAELLDAFALSDRRASMVTDLSGGMAQRLQVARAIAHRPQVLFLDEPTAGLDPQGRIALWTTLSELRRREGLTILLTTHYMEEAERLCERIAVIDHGKLLITDTPDALKSATGADTVIELAVDRPDDELIGVLGGLAGVDSVESADGRVRVMARRTDGLLPQVLAAATAKGLRDLSVSEPTLETVFINLTGRGLRD